MKMLYSKQKFHKSSSGGTCFIVTIVCNYKTVYKRLLWGRGNYIGHGSVVEQLCQKEVEYSHNKLFITNKMYNGIYNKILDGDWFSARLFVTL